MAVRNLPDDTTNGIAALNVNLASGALVLQGAWQVFNKDTGTLFFLSGLGTAARFAAGGGGGGSYTDAQALAAAQAGIPASALNAAQTAQVQNDGVPAAFTSRTLVQADSRTMQTLSAAQTATVPTGLSAGFGVQFQGSGALTVTAASGVTILDQRQSGVTPFYAALVNIGPNSYILRGDKT